MSLDVLSGVFGGAIPFDNSPFYTTHTPEEVLQAIRNGQSELSDWYLPISAVLALKSGDYKSARALFDQIRPEQDCGLFSCAEVIWRALMERFIIEPPAIGVCGTSTGDRAIALEAITGEPLMAAMAKIVSWTSAIGAASAASQRAAPSRTDWLEIKATLLTFNMAVHLRGGGMSYSNKHYPTVRTIEHQAAQLQAASQCLQSIQNFSEVAEILGSSVALKYIDTINLQNDLCRDGRISNIEAMLEKYADDKLMRGRLAVQYADSLLSPAWSNPVLLNTLPILREDAYDYRGLWGTLEDNMQLVSDSGQARFYYDKAMHDFEAIDCVFGVAAVHLRYACLLYGVCLTSRGKMLSADKLEESRALLDKALRLFDGNHTWQLIVKGHILLLAIVSSDRNTALRIAHEIGARALELGNLKVSQLLAKFLLRIGRQQALTFARTDIAIGCWQCASILGKDQWYGFVDFMALYWQSQLHDNQNNSIEAYHFFKRSLDRFLHFGGDISESDAIAQLKAEILIEYDPLAMHILSKIGDEAALQSLKHLMCQWTQNPSIEAQLSSAGTDSAALPAQIRRSMVSPQLLRNTEHKRNEYTRVADAYQRELTAGKIVEATAQLQAFIDRDLNDKAAEPFVEQAYFTLGDFPAMRSLLQTNWSSTRFNFETQPRLGHGESWSRSAVPVQFFKTYDADNALKSCVMAQDWERGQRVLAELEASVPDYLTPAHAYNDRGYRFGNAGMLAEHGSRPDLIRAFRLLVQAWDQSREVRAGTTDTDSQLVSMDIVYAAAFHQSLARLCLKLRDQGRKPFDVEFAELNLQSLNSFEKLAVYYLEGSKASSIERSLSHTNESFDSSLDSGEHARRTVRVLSSVPGKDRTPAETAELLKLIQVDDGESLYKQYAGLVEMGTNQDRASLLDECFAYIPSDCLLIIIQYTRWGKVWFGITSSGIDVAGYSEDNNWIKVRDHAITIQTYIKTSYQEQSWQESSTDVQQGLDYLAEEILGPFLALVASKQQIIFSISVPLTGFPFALLPYDSKPLFLSKAVSITPSLGAFVQLRKRQPNLRRSRVGLITRPATTAEWQRTAETPLPMAAIESLAIASLSPSPHLHPTSSATMTRETLLARLSSNDILHIGTHGHFDSRSPWLSSISLETPLRVLDLTTTSIRCGLVVLAACESGLGKLSFIEEAIGFSHALLSGCANAVLGSLWEVDDTATMLLMVRFYKELWACEVGTSLAEVWRRAQVWLYEIDTAEAARREMQRLEECLDVARGRGIDVDVFVERPKKRLRRAAAGLRHGFDHPFFWASFALTGNGVVSVVDEGV